MFLGILTQMAWWGLQNQLEKSMKPQDELSLVSPGSFTYNSRDFHV